MHKHILIADDHTTIRRIVKEVLVAKLDINDCEEAANGLEAIELAERTKPDLVILDVAMPEMDGLTAAKRLKQSMPGIPIVSFTTYDLGQNSATNFGVDAVVTKPDGLDKLSSEVRALLSR